MILDCVEIIYIYIAVKINRGGAGQGQVQKLETSELYADKAGTPIVKLFNFWHFTNKVSPFSLTFLCWVW